MHRYLRKGVVSALRKRHLWFCGIIGFVGNESARDYLLEGLEILRNRGYDSAGISTVANQDETPSLTTTKFASVSTSDSFNILKEATEGKHLSFCGIGHTRWATHGAITDVNAHPHNDTENRIALVHNGTIENWSELKTALEKKGTVFRSETDSEIVVQLIASFYDEKKDIVGAFSKAISLLEGTYGLAVICKDYPDQILVVRNGSPLLIGISEGKKWVASEYTAFSRYTKRYISLKDGEITIIKKDHISVDFVGRLRTAPPENFSTSPAPYDYWTIKEIMEQPTTVNNAINNGGRINNGSVVLGGMEGQREVFARIRKIVICACGTSYYASLFASKLMRQLHLFDSVHLVDASEFDMDYFPSLTDTALLVVSQSGETADVLRAIKKAQAHNVFVFAVVNVVSSQIARLARCGVYTNSGREFGVASTKSFTGQVVVLTLISLWFASNFHREETWTVAAAMLDSLSRIPFSLPTVLELRDQCREIARRVHRSQTLFVLGKGLGEAIAKEAALKIKEIAYIHAEGFSSGELKHGPFALIEKGTPVFVVLLDDSDQRLIRIACEQVCARGAELFVVTDNAAAAAKEVRGTVVEIPSVGALTALVAIVPFQLIAYEAALLKGLDPDKPRNLAKAVTVD